MSEYQYYEFLAIDRPLSPADMQWLRRLSTRAHITPTSFTNEYHWGDFKGDPWELMKRCFDAHVYTSNFGIRRLMLRIPAGAHERGAMKAYRGAGSVVLRPYCDGLVVGFSLEGEPGEWDDDADGTPWMASLAPLRVELLDGDWRCLYVAWLLSVQFDALDPEVREPPVPPGLAELSAPCEALVAFLHIDPALLAVAAEPSQPFVAPNPEPDWHILMGGLSAAEKDDLLLQFLLHDDPATARRLRKRLRDGQARVGFAAGSGAEKHRRASGRRTVGELAAEWHRRVSAAQQRAAEAASRERARRSEEQARARRQHLAQVAARTPAAWNAVKVLIESRTPKGYDQAVVLLTDLRDAAALQERTDAFVARLRELRAEHASKPSLLRRLDVAKLP